jgi:hypothetical protein
MSKHDKAKNLTPEYARNIARLLPGDVIHDQAPTSGSAPSGVRIAAVDSARVARMRKLQRRARQASK